MDSSESSEVLSMRAAAMFEELIFSSSPFLLLEEVIFRWELSQRPVWPKANEYWFLDGFRLAVS